MGLYIFLESFDEIGYRLLARGLTRQCGCGCGSALLFRSHCELLGLVSFGTWIGSCVDAGVGNEGVGNDGREVLTAGVS